MKIYFAPLEGVTTHIFRNIYNDIYGGIDKYFAPFVSPSDKRPLTPRERKDIAPENNSGINMVPQILTCRSDCFIKTAKDLHDMGYGEVNLNLGCPSGTVCSKGKGAGFLPETAELKSFLDDIYSYAEAGNMKISIKTRLGYYSADEFYDLMDIFNQYPVSELIVHPRARSDFYKGDIRTQYYSYALEHSGNPLVYNGNINSIEDYGKFKEILGDELSTVMLGRGLIADPSLADKLKGVTVDTDYGKFKRLHDTLFHEYQKIMSPDINVLFKMRELWIYWQVLFEGYEHGIKKIFKAKKCIEYEQIAEGIIQDRLN